ncbi:phosphoglycerate kinase [Candidatus Mycoplasma haematobovis]|uniref:Phosphoglycerate kinase n=1 Tax=Candidatus Mycoplasma haematobovis TaxID=432608 RepID=A0A1A9QFJ3_9MOLU|nr:phosphoglycerate kinase [Candidatus Mycoplasma haematobovis]OAL10716.1 phosphoglycerate kinase [Candidatus Mycoplasma haematobovis]
MVFNKRSLEDLELNNKKVILRLDLNVPVKDGVITDNNRIVQSLPTLKYLLDKQCKIVVLSHFSRIKDLNDINSGKKSLAIVAKEIQKQLPSAKVLFVPREGDKFSKDKIDFSADILVLENTRYYDVDESNNVVKWESKNYPELAKFWASLGEVFINDAFGTSHRAHASNVGVSELLPSGVGFLVKRELEALSKAVTSTDSPRVLILGGSKVSDKLKLINAIAPKVDKLLIGGGMSYTFLKAMGKEVGKSIVEDEMIEECKSLLSRYGDKLLLPVDHIVASEFKDVKGEELDLEEKNWGGKMALDIGSKTVKLYCEALEGAKVVIWNGPMGVFEFDNYENGTKSVALKLAEITKKGAYTVIGGGDSAAAAEKFKLTQDMSFISTGGGASLAFFEGSKMPGIEAIPNK